MLPVLLGYGPVGDLAAICAERRATVRKPPERATDSEVRKFEAYARMLAGRYPMPKGGADSDDVEQQAMVAAWEAIARFKANDRGRLVPFVQQRMRWRVIDYVRVRTGSDRADAGRLSWDAEIDGWGVDAPEPKRH